VALGEPILEANGAAIDLPSARQRGSELRYHRSTVSGVDAQDPDEREGCRMLRKPWGAGAEREDKESRNVPHSITASA